MMRLVAFLGLGLALCAQPAVAKGALSDAQVKQKIIKASIANYDGNCPCPFNSASNGSRCGGRSAWSRKGGASPKCFTSDVSAADVKRWRVSH